MKNKRKIIIIVMLILFSIIRYFSIKSDIEVEHRYDLLAFQFADLFLLVIYFPLYIFLIVGELKKYYSTNYISRFNKINKYNFYILRKILLITFEYCLALLVINWIEANLSINYLSDFSLFMKYLAFIFNLFLAYMIIAYIYSFVNKLINEIFAIFVIIILNMLEVLNLLNNFLFNKLFIYYQDDNYYSKRLSITAYLLAFFAILYLIYNGLSNKVDIQRGEYEQ